MNVRGRITAADRKLACRLRRAGVCLVEIADRIGCSESYASYLTASARPAGRRPRAGAYYVIVKRPEGAAVLAEARTLARAEARAEEFRRGLEGAVRVVVERAGV